MAKIEIRNPRFEQLDEIWPLRPQADETHLAAEHIPQLRQFIEPALAKKRANVCDAIVVLLGPCWPDMPFGILSHRAEFMDHETAAEQSDALLAEDRTSGRV